MTLDPTRAPWTSRNGVAFPDRVPSASRASWVARGWCPDRDLYGLFHASARAHPRRQAVVECGEPAGGGLDFAALDAEVRRICALFTEAGLGAGDVIALRLPNGRHAVAAELAVYAIGAVALPYPLGGGRRDTLALLGRSRARAAVFADASDIALRDQLPDLETVFCPTPDRPGARWLGAGARRGWRPVDVDPAAPARLLVSSGSEAEPKMVAYAHHAMAGGRANYLRALAPDGEPGRHLVLVSLASSFGSCGIVTLAALGATLLVQPAFEPRRALAMVTAHRPTRVFAVPTMLRRLADTPPAADEDLTSVTAVVSSGADLPRETARLCGSRFNRPVITVYGSSDGVNCHTPAADSEAAAGCVGVPDPSVAAIRIAGADGRPLPPGEPGEILARGPMTPLCYVAAPELDARYRTDDGWVRTGDRGLLDERGRLFLLGRIKNVVLRGGYTISAAEVERELGAHPAVAEAACVPVPDPDLGERLCACVRPAPGTPPPSLAELNVFLLRQRGLEKRKLPEHLLSVQAMPYGPTGKICRRTLTERAGARYGRRP
ncbi:class I adenylate-forming enzyme family protein [Streptomyces profundus]|uniref:class I adenylate-forming enzyme family protein n=1 Tax=Streptomyces profundus TaxID=2867410 RepID=UPI001D16233D|nr:class I adenylate-forming enzyme family protein [Streptomyces sp. MA3_2.13]UED87816.1 acyl--CoA ligase [Streptomyces sp. MA3_2.13]